ncbi:MAG: dockerin type I domain-containing protein, partial [Candidatus Hydrogenedentes bacterium]|nr:dockerin type I domain-containing protein [Candidatus Hydrogenedentota bacterium]
MRIATVPAVLLTFLLCCVLAETAWALPGDIDDSGRIDIADLTAFSRAFGTSQGEEHWNDNADLDRNGTVDDGDLAILAQYFGRTGLSQGVWVADRNNNAVVRLGSKEGGEVIRLPDFQAPESVSLDSSSGVLWVADRGNAEVVKFSADGTQVLARVVGFSDPSLVAVNMSTSACWVADRGVGQIYRLAEDISDGYDVTTDTASHRSVNGFDVNTLTALAVDPVRGNLWAGSSADLVARIDVDAADGYDISTDTGSHTAKDGFSNPLGLSVDLVTGDCWVADQGLRQILVLSRGSLSKLSEITDFNGPNGLSVNSVDGTCWVADGANLLRLGDLGNTELLRLDGFSNLFAVHADTCTGGCWVPERGGMDAVIKIAPGGQELLRSEGFFDPVSLTLTLGETIGTAPTASAAADKESAALDE